MSVLRCELTELSLSCKLYLRLLQRLRRVNLRFRTSAERVLRASGLHQGRPVSAAAAAET